MSIVNLTGLSVTLLREDGTHSVLRPSERRVATVRVQREPIDREDGVPIVLLTYGDVENLPEPEEDVYFLVMPSVARVAALQGRVDVVTTDSIPGQETGFYLVACDMDYGTALPEQYLAHPFGARKGRQ